MINLLPPDHQRALVFARRNNSLRRGIVGLCIGLLLLLVVTGANTLVLHTETISNRDMAATIEKELAAKNESAVIQRMNQINNTLKLVIDVLSEQVLYAELYQQIGSVMPSGSVLRGLSVTEDLSSGLDLQIAAVDFHTGSQVLVNILDQNNQIFRAGDMIGLTCDNQPDSDDPYPCTGTIKALFQEDNPFSFLHRQQTMTESNNETN